MRLKTVHRPLLFVKIFEIKRLALWESILDALDLDDLRKK